MKDSNIVDLYLARDEEAIVQSAKSYGKKIKSLAGRICNDETIAEECENDTYLRAWNSIPPHEPRTYLFSFLAKITRFLAIDRLKEMTSQKRNAEIVELSHEIESVIPSGQTVDSEFMGDELKRIINAFLRKLPEEKRNVFIRRYWFMESVAEISEKYSISEGKVKTILFRVRAELKKWLEKEGYSI